jgi:hypothetical protein
MKNVPASDPAPESPRMKELSKLIHDIRNDLNSLVLTATDLRERVNDPAFNAAADQILNLSMQASRRMAELREKVRETSE